jgi:thiol-disulfide isomerase/thioredoxin
LADWFLAEVLKVRSSNRALEYTRWSTRCAPRGAVDGPMRIHKAVRRDLPAGVAWPWTARAGVRVLVLIGALAIIGACKDRTAVSATTDAAGGSPGGSAAVKVLEASSKDVLAAVRRARGDVVLVNIWATWCEPCRQELPDLIRVNRDLKDKNFKLILVSADFPDIRPQVVRFLTDSGVDFPTYLKAENDGDFINGLEPRWSGALPASILFGADGVKRDFWEGKADYETFSRRVSALLPQGQVKPAVALERTEPGPNKHPRRT